MAVNAHEIPRYAPPTQAELEEMFGERTFPCDTCRHRCELYKGMLEAGGRRRAITEDWCVAAHDNADGGVNFRIDARSVPDPCPQWEEED